VESKCKLEIALSPKDQKDFLTSIKVDAMGTINTMLATIDVRKSKSSKRKDTMRIFDAVERTVGFHGINSLIFQHLREWVIDTALISIFQCANERERVERLKSLGLLCVHQGLYDIAEQLFLDSINICEGILDSKDHLIIGCMNDLAGLYSVMDKI